MLTLLIIPQIAWPALTQFAPEKFPELQARLLHPDLTAQEQSQVRHELQLLINEFHKWAVSYLRRSAHGKLVLMGAQERVGQFAIGLKLKKLHELESVDLTPTENRRLGSQFLELDFAATKPKEDGVVKSIEDAVKALEKPWKYLDWKPGK